MSDDHNGWIGAVPDGGGPHPGWVRDLAYFVGYRIAQGYHEQAADKRQAIRDLLDNRDPKAILIVSGYRGGDS